MSISVNKTTYETGVEKAVIVVDVYGESATDSPTNNETSPLSILDNIKLESIIPKSASDLISKVTRTPNLSLTDAIGMISKVAGDPKAFGKAVGDNIMNDVLSSVGYNGTVDDVIKSFKEPINFRDVLTAAGEQNAQLKMIIGDVDRIISKEDLQSATGIAKVLEELSGNSNLTSILDIAPQLSMVKGMVNEAMRLGLPEAVDGLIDSFEDDDDKRRLRLFSTVNAAANSALTFIETQLDSEDIGAGAIMSFAPNITTSILSNYKLNDKYPTDDDVVKLIGVVKRLDDGWMKYDRNGVVIEDISSLNSASEDALRVLMKNPDTQEAALMCGGFINDVNMVDYTLNLRNYGLTTV